MCPPEAVHNIFFVSYMWHTLLTHVLTADRGDNGPGYQRNQIVGHRAGHAVAEACTHAWPFEATVTVCNRLLTVMLARRRREAAAEAAAGAARAELEGLHTLVKSLQAQLKSAR